MTAAGTLGSTSTPIPVDGIPCLVSLEMTTSGSNVTCTLNVINAANGAVSTQSFTATSVTNRDRPECPDERQRRARQQRADSGNVFGRPVAAHRHQHPRQACSGVGPGETDPGTGLARLCGENNLQSRIYGYPNESVAMGEQAVDTLTNLLQTCEDADRGQISEPPDSHSLGYRTLRSQVNQAPAVTLDYSKAQAGDQENSPVSLVSVDDDQYTTNDWLITRTNGSGYEAMLADGSRMSVTAPELGGIGPYQNTKTVVVNLDAQLPDIAGWMCCTCPPSTRNGTRPSPSACTGPLLVCSQSRAGHP